MSADSESFLARWSRRKLEAERPAEDLAPDPSAPPPAKEGSQQAAAGAPVPAPAPERDPAQTTEVPLPPIESLDGLRSDYQAFFQQPVADELRRAALKKLFADPHFNQMDMMDVYVDDYTQFEPLPAALRVRLPSARGFLLDSERAALDAAEESAGAAADAAELPVATAGVEADPAARADAGGEDSGVAAADANVDPMSPRPVAPNGALVDGPSADDPARVPSSPAAEPPGTAPDSDSSTR